MSDTNEYNKFFQTSETTTGGNLQNQLTWVFPYQDVCPLCGHCRHCGRSGYHTYPVTFYCNT